MHLSRFHGFLAPNHKFREQVVPPPPPEEEDQEPVEEGSVPCHPQDPRRLRWSELLKRVYNIDLETCPDCGGALTFIATIVERAVVEKILTHLALPVEPPKFHPARAPPQMDLFSDY